MPLPPDLVKKLDSGEAVLMLPEGGLDVYAGKDVYEYIEAQERKKKNKKRYVRGSRTWHKK